MNFGKVKTIFIVLFLIINILLLYYSFYLENDAVLVNDTQIQRVYKILEQNNITINKNLIKSSYSDMSFVELKNPVSEKTDFAHRLTGSSISSNNTYNGKNGKLSFYDGEFSFSPKDKGDNINSALPSAAASAKVLSILKSYGFKTDYLKWAGTVEKNDYYEVTFVHSYLNYEFFNSYLKVLVKEDGVYKVFGKYFEITGLSDTKNIKSPIEILINFVKYNKNNQNHINNLELGYYINSAMEEYSVLTMSPTYKISLKNGNTLFFDALSGTFTEFIEYNS